MEASKLVVEPIAVPGGTLRRKQTRNNLVSMKNQTDEKFLDELLRDIDPTVRPVEPPPDTSQKPPKELSPRARALEALWTSTDSPKAKKQPVLVAPDGQVNSRHFPPAGSKKDLNLSNFENRKVPNDGGVQLLPQPGEWQAPAQASQVNTQTGTTHFGQHVRSLMETYSQQELAGRPHYQNQESQISKNEFNLSIKAGEFSSNLKSGDGNSETSEPPNAEMLAIRRP